MTTLYDSVRSAIEDLDTVALIAETEMEPISGLGTSIAPPTYAGEPRETPTFAVSKNVAIPARAEGSAWHLEVERNKEAVPRLAQRVVIDSIGAQAGRAETALWERQAELEIALPGFVVSGGDQPSTGDDFEAHQVSNALDIEFSSWTVPHRHVGAEIRYAQTSDGKQVWQGGRNGDIEPRALIASAGPRNGEVLYRNFPNSALFGFWLSSGVAARHRLPRAYSSEIVGYGAEEVKYGSTKFDALGNVIKDFRYTLDSDGALVPAQKGGKEPSKYGFGQVPTSPYTRAFTCSLILQHSSISLPVLRSIKFGNDKQALAARTVLVLLGIIGNIMANQDLFLRSECALVAGKSRWGWRRSGQLDEPVELTVASLDEVIAALKKAINEAAKLGIEFAEPIYLSLSNVQRKMIEDVVTRSLKVAEHSE